MISLKTTFRLGLSSIAIFVIVTGLTINKWHKYRVVRAYKHQLVQAKKEAEELLKFGFGKSDNVILVLRSRQLRLQETIERLQSQWFVLPEAGPKKGEEVTYLQKLIKLNRKMLYSYIRDIRDYEKLGLKDEDTVVRFAQDKVVRLSLSLGDLEKQLEAAYAGELNFNQLHEKVHRMIAINEQSLNKAKELLKVAQLDLFDENVTPLKLHIAKRVSMGEDLHQML